jgi:hypothetical protein
MALEIEGKLHKIFPSERKSDSFQTREFVIEIEDGNYPQVIKFQLVQDKCSVLDDYAEGGRVRVHFNLRGREWQGKFLTNLNAWRLEKLDGSESAAPRQAASKPMPSATSDFPSFDAEPMMPSKNLDDLPF